MQILIVDDEVRYRELYMHVLEAAGFMARAVASAEEAIAILRTQLPAMVVSDVRMPGASGIELLRRARKEHPGLPFLLVTAYADVRDAVSAMRLGAVDYLSKPVDLDELLAAVRDAVGVYDEVKELTVPSEALRGIVAESPAMRNVLREAYRVAQSDANILLTGESGTGKEVVARFIHQNSPRRDKTMIVVNCASIPGALLAGELFGHEKGAFTGAVTKRLGLFREAEGSTLFLDEIGDMPIELQPALLRAIEASSITPLGGGKEIKVDYRLLAATNRALLEEVEAGRFRQDLYYRLNVIAIEIPPLRERTEDVLPLARHFLATRRNEDKRLSRAAAQALAAHPWPGNVRELSNAIERAWLLSQTDVILPEHLPPVVRMATSRSLSGAIETDSGVHLDVQTLEASEADSIRRALEQTEGNRTRAADLLGITRRGLIYKMKRLGIT
jgi:DNA-binding NtrC family response regulator